jgi:hypothetical protein
MYKYLPIFSGGGVAEGILVRKKCFGSGTLLVNGNQFLLIGSLLKSYFKSYQAFRIRSKPDAAQGL